MADIDLRFTLVHLSNEEPVLRRGSRLPSVLTLMAQRACSRGMGQCSTTGSDHFLGVTVERFDAASRGIGRHLHDQLGDTGRLDLIEP